MTKITLTGKNINDIFKLPSLRIIIKKDDQKHIFGFNTVDGDMQIAQTGDIIILQHEQHPYIQEIIKRQ